MSIKNTSAEKSAFTYTNQNVDELVINWHITEKCNYNCTYCFAKWGRPNELHNSIDAVEQLLDNLANYFIRGDSLLKRKLGYKSVRLNLAGGEPTILGGALSTILLLAKQRGFRTSVITNGHYLETKRFNIPNNTLDMIGISFDSQSQKTRLELGRADHKGKSFCSESLKNALYTLKGTQHGIKVKINTVVNKLNWNENFSDLISIIKPDKWKVLQVMPYGDNEMLISDEQFQCFVNNHCQQVLPISVESNSDMLESYIMIDPMGRFYQNLISGYGYNYSECINKIGAEKALKQVSFNESVFVNRYLPSDSVNFCKEGALL